MLLNLAAAFAVALAVAVTWEQRKPLERLPCSQHCPAMFYMGVVNQKTLGRGQCVTCIIIISNVTVQS